ncbi:MAG TPA: hypothetical protein VFH97_01655, partial [Gemmatimonadales bacterium]|nr:hypothetical protein [Gemmatimonadales bacterium]
MPPGELPTVSVPAGHDLDVFLINASLPVVYRIRQEDTGLDRPHVRDPRDLPSRVAVGNFSMPARVCPADGEPAWNALLQQQDEARMKPTIEALRAALGSGQCRDIAEHLLVRSTRRPLNTPVRMTAGL